MKKNNSVKLKTQTVELQTKKTIFDVFFTFSTKLSSFLSKHYYILVIIAFAYTAILANIVQKYHVNDNIAILEDIKGGFAVSFMTFSLGNFFSFLYLNANSSIEWYGWFLYLVTAINVSLILYTLSKAKNLRLFFIPLATSYLTLIAYFIIEIGYNSVSFLSGGVALFAFIVYLFHNERINYFKIVFLGVLFSFSYLVRIKAILGVIAFGFPILLLIIIIHFKRLWKPFLIFLLPLAFAYTFNYLYKLTDLNQQEKEFREFNVLRGQFHDFNVARINLNNAKIQSVNNWTIDDYQMLNAWIFVDENKYNKQTIQTIFDYSFPLPNKMEMIKNVDFNVLSEYYTSIYNKFILFILIILLLHFIYSSTIQNWWILFYVIYVFLFVFYMLVFERFPSRIGNPILFISSLFALLSVAIPLFPKNMEIKFTSTKKWIISLFTVLAFFYLYKQIYVLNDYVKLQIEKKEDFNTTYERLQTNYANKFILIQPGVGLRTRNQSPLKNYNYKFKTIGLGWNTFSPRFYSELKQLGLKKGSELLPFLIDNNEAYLLINEEVLHIVLHFIRDTYKVHCKIVTIENIKENISIFQLKTEELTPPTPNHFRKLTWEEYLRDLEYLKAEKQPTKINP